LDEPRLIGRGYGHGTRRKRGRREEAAPEEEIGTVNKVLLTGRLTRDPELRSLASGSSVATFAVATNEFRGNGKERAEYHNVVVWDRLAQVCGQYLGKGQQVAIEGRLQTRQWDDDRGTRHWKTEVVATSVEMLSGRRKRDYEADSLAAQAGDPGAGDPAAISPNEAAEVGVVTVADALPDESASSDDEQVLVLV
jgi:single-strand DNA-binding protein